MERTKVIFGHLNKCANESAGSGSGVSCSVPWPVPRQCSAALSGAAGVVNRQDDVVIVSARRTALCKAKRGQFKDTLPDDLLSAVFTAVIEETGLEPSLIGDICVGNVLQPGSAATIGRLAQFFSGITEDVPLSAVNRQCSSGLQACANITAGIKAGYYEIGLAAGVESMSLNSMQGIPPGFAVNPRVMEVDKAQQCLMPMGLTSENIAEQYGISREQQDQLAVDSHLKAANAQKNGYFVAEIVPVTTMLQDKDGNENKITVVEDDGIRAGTSMEGLSRLRTVFKEDGTTTAGNSSQMTDGASAVLLASRCAAARHGLPVLGVMRAYAVVGCPPDIMGIGPAVAIPEALQKAGLSIDDIDIFEINEAFASQAVYCVEKLGIPWHKVNPNGGAVAIGHPLGCTGARQVTTLLHELKRRGKRSFGVVSMCIGTGMGAAAVLEYPGINSKVATTTKS